MTRRDHDSLRASALRLAAQFTALTLATLVVVGGIVFALVSASLGEASERALTAAAQLDSPRDAAEGTYITIAGVHRSAPGREDDSESVPDELIDLSAIDTVGQGGAPVRSARTVDGRNYELLTTTRGDAVVQVAIDQHERDEELARLGTALLVAGGIAVILSAAAAYVMARRAIRPLADALALQRRFVADASHELRTPLTVLSTRAQLLQRRSRSTDVPADVPVAIDELVDDAKALATILDDLLVAADPRSMADTSAVDVAEVIDEVIAQLGADAVHRDIALTATRSSSPVIRGSRAALVRLILNLVSNAVDHARSAVTVSLSVDHRTVLIRVVDDGPGFTADIAAHAFERFASARTPDEGTRHYGLGLALVAEIVDRLGGRVEIESVAAGASVAVRLPLPA